MKNSNLSLALCCILSICLSSCAEQGNYSAVNGKTIASLTIRHTTPKLVQDRQILHLISSQPGSAYNEINIDDDIKTLWESGLVDDVKFSTKSNNDSVNLIASVSTRRGCCSPVLFLGNSAFSDSKLLKQLSVPVAKRISRATTMIYDTVSDEPVVDHDEGVPSDLLHAACKELEHYYHSNGFPKAIVTIRYSDDNTFNHSGFLFLIDENPRK